ncbi:4989_t:CDS:1 [Ambispora gerdemannii]|uniref:4989_t:CDS:1 n=1 Tax=Ambispora gerdemannii TaxID=144530 RepID=A0A9N8V767_9GLOM|nr:4989_t:CDS:1 [Ambispora gerdemannii]
MKLLNTLLLVAGSTVLFTTNPSSACEKTCRVGISTTFAEKYGNVTHPIWVSLYQNLEDTALDNVVFPSKKDSVTQKLRKQILLTLNNKAKKLETNFNKRLPNIVEHAIFVQKPQFRGDCNHPFRVKQPKPPAIWKMSDCRKMNYICGNPPSICHFLDMIKKRNVKAIKSVLSKEATTKENFLATLSNAVNQTLHNNSEIIKKSEIPDIVAAVKVNIVKSLTLFAGHYNSEFCKGNSCDRFDLEIKKQLLTYP